ncbi:hypothetical protein DXG01_013491, partial [Tephrocybe rancida]
MTKGQPLPTAKKQDPPDTENQDALNDKNQDLLKDDRYKEHLRFLRRRIRVVGKHPLKDYEGIITDILLRDIVVVEVQAGLRREPIHLSNVAL